MFQVLRDFFFDGATFKRVASDVTVLVSAAATTPDILPAVAALFPGASWLPPILILAGGFYSGRARQLQTPKQ